MKTNKIKFEELLKIIMTEMCNRVNADYNTLDFKDNDNPYFMKYSWTEKEQDNFKDWMIKLFKENKNYYKLFVAFPRITKIEKAVNFFVDNHGWKTKIEK